MCVVFVLPIVLYKRNTIVVYDNILLFEGYYL